MFCEFLFTIIYLFIYLFIIIVILHFLEGGIRLQPSPLTHPRPPLPLAERQRGPPDGAAERPLGGGRHRLLRAKRLRSAWRRGRLHEGGK